MAIAAKKNDMYEYEEVEEKEGISFKKQHNAIFQITTAKDSNGSIDLLFKSIGKTILNPNIENTSVLTKDEIKNRGEQLKQERNKTNKKFTWILINPYKKYFIFSLKIKLKNYKKYIFTKLPVEYFPKGFLPLKTQLGNRKPVII